MTVEPQTVDTDVLVVGGGLAALRAALDASATGATVTVAVKRKLGRCGSSAVTSGGYAATDPAITPQDSWERHYADTLTGGGLINDRTLARILCQEAGLRLNDLLRLGAPFVRTNGHYSLSPSGDHSSPRVVTPVNMRGTDMTLPLREAVVAAGVRVLENTYVLDLLTDDVGVAGALGYDHDRGTLVLIRAKAVVMGTGGAGRIFTVTSNPVDVVGDGYALAARAGAPLRDMEMVQFYPWRAIRPFKGSRVPIQPSTFVIGARLYNARGERFMERYDPQRKESTTRDVAARAIFDQIRQGLDVDGGVILDLSDVTDDDFRTSNKKVVERLDPRGVNFRDVQFIIAPEAHFVMGGMVIDETCRTPVERLYACGEAAGGVHGANRLNSNAIPDTQVFGARAGRLAAEQAQRDEHGRIDDRIVRAWAGRLEAVGGSAGSGGGHGVLEQTREEFQQAMSLALGIVRTREALTRGLGVIETQRERLRGMTPQTGDEFQTAAELVAMADAAEAMCHSALVRTESRGAHYREDFPERDDARWVQTVVVRREAGGRVSTGLHPIDVADDARYLGAATVTQGLTLIKGEHVE